MVDACSTLCCNLLMVSMGIIGAWFPGVQILPRVVNLFISIVGLGNPRTNYRSRQLIVFLAAMRTTKLPTLFELSLSVFFGEFVSNCNPHIMFYCMIINKGAISVAVGFCMISRGSWTQNAKRTLQNDHVSPHY